MTEHRFQKDLRLTSDKLTAIQEHLGRLSRCPADFLLKLETSTEKELSFSDFGLLRKWIDSLEAGGYQIEGADIWAGTCVVGADKGQIIRKPTGKSILTVHFSGPADLNQIKAGS